jgi:hypothetical protein
LREHQQADAHPAQLVRVLGVVHREEGVVADPGEPAQVEQSLNRAKAAPIGWELVPSGLKLGAMGGPGKISNRQ